MGVENLSFTDNNPPQCDSLFLNSAKAEINNIIANTGQSSTTSNLNQLGIAVAIMAAGSDFYTDSGTANAYVCSPVGGKSAPNAYFVGMRVRFVVGHSNTATSTVNVNSLGVKGILGRDGVSALNSGDFVAGTEVEIFYNGTNFVVANGVAAAVEVFPVGAMLDFPGTSAPSGWLLCAGQAVSRTTYSALFGLLGTNWGIGDGTSTFNLPDFRGRVRIGLDNMGGTNANRMTAANASILGAGGGGSELTTPTGAVAGTSTTGDTTLSTGQIPPLSYTVSFTFASPGGGTSNLGSGQGGVSPSGTSSLVSTNAGGGSHNHTGGSLSATFTGTAGNTTQPWLAVGVIIKT